MEGFYKGGWDKEVISKRKRKARGRKVRVLDNDGFSLAVLHELLLAGLAAGQKENLSPVGMVK